MCNSGLFPVARSHHGYGCVYDMFRLLYSNDRTVVDEGMYGGSNSSVGICFADVRVNLAEEFVRAEHEADHEDDSEEGDAIDMYHRYVEAARKRSSTTSNILDLEEFLSVMRDQGQL